MDFAMGAMGLGFILTLRDEVSNNLDKIRNKLLSFKDTTQEVLDKFDAGVRNMMGGFSTMYVGKRVLGFFDGMIGGSVRVAASFEQAMAGVAAVSGATGKEFAELRNQAEQLGRDTQFSASQAANAQELLARAGFKTKEITASMPGLLDMAAAEGMGLAQAADIASSILRGFGKDASEMTNVANILAQTSASSNVSIATLGEAMKNVGPDAKGLGLDIKDVAAMIGVLGNAGIQGGRAGTALSSALAKISSPTAAARKSLSELGVAVTDSSGNLRYFPQILGEIFEAMQTFSA